MKNITFNFTKTIVVTDGDNNNEIMCIIITQDDEKTIADIESVKQKNPGAWSFDDILIELSKKPYITDIIQCIESYQL